MRSGLSNKGHQGSLVPSSNIIDVVTYPRLVPLRLRSRFTTNPTHHSQDSIECFVDFTLSSLSFVQLTPLLLLHPPFTLCVVVYIPFHPTPSIGGKCLIARYSGIRDVLTPLPMFPSPPHPIAPDSPTCNHAIHHCLVVVHCCCCHPL